MLSISFNRGIGWKESLIVLYFYRVSVGSLHFRSLFLPNFLQVHRWIHRRFVEEEQG